MNHNAWPAGTFKSLRKNKKTQRHSVKSHDIEYIILLVFCFVVATLVTIGRKLWHQNNRISEFTT